MKLKRTTSYNIILGSLIIVLCIAVALVSNVFISATNITNIFQQISVLGIVTAGMGMIILSGGIDLSVGSQMSSVGAAVASMIAAGMPVWAALLLGMLIGIAFGAINGMLVAYTRAEPFIITLGMMSFYRGIALILTRGLTISVNNVYDWLGRGTVGPIPVPVIVFLFIAVMMYLLMKYTSFGRAAYTIGGNPTAAYLSGIKVRGNKVLIYILNSAIAAFAAIVLLSRLGATSPSMGDGFELRSIAAAVMGGIALSGGRGNIVGGMLGVLLLGIISNALNILNVPTFYQDVALGGIIVLAVLLSTINFQKKKG